MKPIYTVSLTLSGDKLAYEGKGSSLEEALANLKRPVKLMSKGWITATDGAKTAKLWMMPNRLKLFLRPISRVYSAVALQRVMK